MLPEIQGSIAALKGAIDILKAAKGVTDQAQIDAIFFDMREAMANVQEKMLETQAVANSVLEERANLLKQLEEEREKNQSLEGYSLVQPRDGVFLYLYQPPEGSQAPSHTACPNCFSEKLISILQKPQDHNSKIECPKCDFSYNPKTEDEIKTERKEFAESMSRPKPKLHY